MLPICSEINNHFFVLQETHIMHKFTSEFYGCVMRVCIVGFIRPMENYSRVGMSYQTKQ